MRVRITVWLTSGSVSSRPQRRRRGGEGRHARRHVVGDAERVQPAHLLGDRAVERRIAGVDARHVLAAACACRHLGDDLVEVSGAVSMTRAPGGASATTSRGTSEPA